MTALPGAAPTPGSLDAQLDASSAMPLWLDTPDRPQARQPLSGPDEASLVVVGGGFTGLWAALRAKERDPDRDVLLVEATRIADGATGRNGGFCEASLTHGEANGKDRWPEEFDLLEQLGRENLDEIVATVSRYGIDCGLEHTGQLMVATRPHEVEGLDPHEPGFLDAAEVRALVDSPTYLAGRWEEDGCALVDPARLAWGLAAAAEALGVRIVENTPVTGIHTSRTAVEVVTARGTIRCDKALLATNAYRPLLRRLRFSMVPVYDYVLATEPLTSDQLASVGWSGRQGVADCGNQFHYYRLTSDNRILWGGYDAIYYFGRKVDPALDDRRSTHRVLAEHFYETFPTLSSVRFTHRWGGVIDTSTRFCAFFGTASKGRVGYALGFTGLGVGASRFAADVMLDLVDDLSTVRTGLKMVRSQPMPFPPEPLAWPVIQLTRWSMARADDRGRRNAWLRLLDRLGLGFDS